MRSSQFTKKMGRLPRLILTRQPYYLDYSFNVSPNAQFVTDQKGEKTSVILPLAEYEALLEDLAAAAERAHEPTIPFDQVIANLKKDGLVQD
jgi:hypothetical protein